MKQDVKHIVPSSLGQSQTGQAALMVFEMGDSNTVDNAYSVESARVWWRDMLCSTSFSVQRYQMIKKKVV